MRSALIFFALVLAVNAGVVPGTGSNLRFAKSTEVLKIDTSALAHRFDGIGAISGGGATSRLLVDYPEPQRGEILDWLFKPNFGASLHMLKVEIGGDSQSTDGTEPSHMHYSGDLDYSRGYEWWLMTEAKKRNPDILIYGLPWAFPGFVGKNDGKNNPWDYPELTVDYVLKWIEGAQSVYKVPVDYIGVWNERPSDAAYVKLLRKTLDSKGFKNVKIVANDGDKSICDDLAKDSEYAAAVDVVGLHYPSDYDDYSTCQKLNKPFWASEESSSYDDLNGAACWARITTSHYVLNNMTSSIMWNLAGSYMHGTNWYASSLMTGVQPWSGYYERDNMPVLWAAAHLTQFALPGWMYLAQGHGTGSLPLGGFYTTLVDPKGSDFSIIVAKISRDHAPCTRPELPDFDVSSETITIDIGKATNVSKLRIFRSNLEGRGDKIFSDDGWVTVKSGRISIDVDVGDYITLSTVTTAQKGTISRPLPPSQPKFPLPYSDDFTGYSESSEARYFTDQIGAFEIHDSVLGGGRKAMVQMVSTIPIAWTKSKRGPVSLLGMTEWQDIQIQATFVIPQSLAKSAAGACLGSRVDQEWDNGFVFCVQADGTWHLSIGGPLIDGTYDKSSILETGKVDALDLTSQHLMTLSTTLSSVSFSLDDSLDKKLATTPRGDVDTGFAAIGATMLAPIEFYSVTVQSTAQDKLTVADEFNENDVISTTPCARNGDIDPAQQFELRPNWQLYHVPSGLCVDGSNAASLTLQSCTQDAVKQQFRNDYTNIRNGLQPITLGAYKTVNPETTLVGMHDGSVVLAQLSGHNLASDPLWKSWSYYPNSQQLRNQYTTIPDLGYPKCLSVVKSNQ